MENTIDISDLFEGTGIDVDNIIFGSEKKLQAERDTELTGTVVRELSREDIEKTNTLALGVSQAPPIKNLRDRHHRAAFLIAQGEMSMTEIGMATGYSQSRLSVLKSDPTFDELVAHYRTVREAEFVGVVQKMVAVTDDAVELLAERIEREPDKVTTNNLIEIIKGVGQQAGFTPVQKQVSLNLNGSDIEKMKARRAENQRGRVQRITQEAAHATHQTTASKGIIEVEVGATNGSPTNLLEAPKAKGLSSEGLNIREDDWAAAELSN